MSGKSAKKNRREAQGVGLNTSANALHYQKMRVVLNGTLKKLTDKIEASYRAHKIPADYSLGFVNGLIFVAHQLSGKGGAPQFYNRKTSIGDIPKPVA